MLNLKKKKSKLIIFLIVSSVIFVWWWNRPTLTELKNCRACEGFVEEEESGDEDESDYDSEESYIASELEEEEYVNTDED